MTTRIRRVIVPPSPAGVNPCSYPITNKRRWRILTALAVCDNTGSAAPAGYVFQWFTNANVVLYTAILDVAALSAKTMVGGISYNLSGVPTTGNAQTIPLPDTWWDEPAQFCAAWLGGNPATVISRFDFTIEVELE